MNNRHIQTFLTVSAAFFAMSAPLHSNASSNGSSNALVRTAQYTQCAKADIGVTGAAKAERQS
ncbi:hypothetical protein [Paraburkholderia acidipaludis]|uniref:hypothetical protein n=1 Tax=Paraburkholderia acidipaludis TaxID=660537 RepID=UPI000484D2DD|nr:hypothetical protein [Paraburkholderia acidipaludis]